MCVTAVIKDRVGFKIDKMILRFYSVAKSSARFVIFLALFSCLSQIEVPVEIKGGELIVSGQISTIRDQNIIELGTSADSESRPNPLSGATIKLIDNLGMISYYNETGLGKYSLPNLAGIAGRTYSIEIQTPNGRVYKSRPEKMQEAATLDSVSYEVVGETVVDFEGNILPKNFYKIYANTTLPTNKMYLKWNVNEVFLLSPTDFPDPFGFIPPPCFIIQNADPQRVVVLDGTTFSGNRIKKQLIATREVDWTFLEKHYFTTYQSSITKEAYDYFRKVNILASQVGSIFDTPPAEITGNIVCVSNPSERAFGYFQAANQTFIRRDFYQSDLPFPLLVEKCDFTGDFDPASYLPRCIDCTIVRNSGFERPSWF